MDKFQSIYRVYASRSQVVGIDILELRSSKPEPDDVTDRGLALGAGPGSIFVRRLALAPFARQFQAAHPDFGRYGQSRFTRLQLTTLLARLDHAATFIEHARTMEDLRIIDVSMLQERAGFHSLKGELGRMIADLRFFLQTTLRRSRSLWVIEH